MAETVTTIRETPFGQCIGKTILDITMGEFGGEDAQIVYFHLDNGETFFATIGHEGNPGLMGFIDMDAQGEDDGLEEG